MTLRTFCYLVRKNRDRTRTALKDLVTPDEHFAAKSYIIALSGQKKKRSIKKKEKYYAQSKN